MKSLKDKIFIDLAMDMIACIQKANPEFRKKIFNELYSKIEIDYRIIRKEK